MLADLNLKVLILGYKELQRGISYMDTNFVTVHQNQAELYIEIGTIINEGWFNVVSFDNLAIKQLDLKRIVPEYKWNEFYMGDDSQYTFYLDLVDGKFARNSLAPENERFDILDNIDEMFQKIRKKAI